jgi:hypothetical protein
VCYEITYKINGKKKWEKIGYKSEGVTAKQAMLIRLKRLHELPRRPVRDGWETGKPGCIYFVASESQPDLIKIGFTNRETPTRRIKALQTANPNKLKTLFYVHGTIDDETFFHRLFKSKRQTGEWFKVSIDEIKKALLIYGHHNK